jgi:hypothetical protein
MKYKLIVLLMLSANGFCAENWSVVGDAYDRDDRQLLYREYHYYSDDGLDHRVEYKDPQGKLLAEKAVDYRSGPMTPSFKQQSWLYPETLAVSLQARQLLIQYKSGDSESTQAVKRQQPLVVDAGFDNYIREHWGQLLTGKVQEFYFPAVTRLSLVTLQVKASRCSYPTESDSCFMINSASWLIRLLLAPIELGYDTDTRRLSRFRGLANLSDEQGRGLEVDINYQYR